MTPAIKFSPCCRSSPTRRLHRLDVGLASPTKPRSCSRRPTAPSPRERWRRASPLDSLGRWGYMWIHRLVQLLVDPRSSQPYWDPISPILLQQFALAQGEFEVDSCRVLSPRPASTRRRPGRWGYGGRGWPKISPTILNHALLGRPKQGLDRQAPRGWEQ